MTAALVTRDLVIDIPGRDDGRALSLTVHTGERWGILGPNGAGKTTLLLTLAGLRKPRSGVVEVQGRPLHALSRAAIARGIGVVFQQHHDGFPSTVMETALMGRHPHLHAWAMEGPQDHAIAAAALARRSSGKPIRLASKSVRVPELLKRAQSSSPIYQGVPCDDYFTEAEQVFLAHGGRPHWGKCHTLEADDFARLVPRFHEFLTVRDEYDPQRRFTNAYLERVLGD